MVGLILILGALGGASVSGATDDASASPSKATRQPPPAPPIKYLEAGARLFNAAQTSAQLDLAAKYLGGRGHVTAISSSPINRPRSTPT